MGLGVTPGGHTHPPVWVGAAACPEEWAAGPPSPAVPRATQGAHGPHWRDLGSGRPPGGRLPDPGGTAGTSLAPPAPVKTGSKVVVRLPIPRPGGVQWGLRVGSLPAWPVLLSLWT